MVTTDVASGARSIGSVTPTASASMLVATASVSSTRVPKGSPAGRSASSPGERASHNIFPPIAPRRTKAIQWSHASTSGPTRRPRYHPSNGISAWKPPKNTATRSAWCQRSRATPMPRVAAAAVASIASPTASRRISPNLIDRLSSIVDGATRLTANVVAGPIALVRASSPLLSLLAVTAACSHAAHPRPADPPRPVAPIEAPSPGAVVAEWPPDAAEAAMRQSVAGWLERANGRLGPRLSIEQAGTATLIEGEMGAWRIPVVVRDEASGESLHFAAFSHSASPWHRCPWDDRNTFSEAVVSAAFALRAAPDWLAALPDVIAWTREEPDSLTFVWSLTTPSGTTMCTSATPSHGPLISGCWPEAGPPLPLGERSFAYQYGRRSEVRGAFEVRLASGEHGRVRVRVDEAGRVWRARSAGRGALGPERLAPATPPPAEGPLSLLTATPVAGDASVMTLSTDSESMRCERRGQWRCDAIVARTATP